MVFSTVALVIFRAISKNPLVYLPEEYKYVQSTQQAFYFFDKVQVDGFDIYPGETLGLVGESGCGKSTTGRSILKLVPHKSGKIIFMNKDISSLSSKEMQKIRVDMQMIFQDPFSSLNPRLTIGRAVAEPLKRHNLFKGKDLKEKGIETQKNSIALQ